MRHLSRYDLDGVARVMDMAERVLRNGGEPNYAREKLGEALARTLWVLARLDVPREDVLRLVDAAFPAEVSA